MAKDATDLLEHCKMRIQSFNLMIKIDDEGKLERIFWSLVTCFDWYKIQ